MRYVILLLMRFRFSTCSLAFFVLGLDLAAQTQPTAATDIYKQASPSVVSIEAFNDKGEVGWNGTGFIVAADGKLLTNYHVIRNSKRATVILANGDAYDTVEVMDVDRRKDIALLKIKAVDLQPVRVGSSGTTQVGDTVYSLSNPVGRGLENTLSAGIISGIRQMDGYRLLQTTAPISHGSSGGPLFNSRGEVIGITTETIEQGQNLNFAVPIDYARGMLASPSSPQPLIAFYEPVSTTEPAATTPPPPAASENTLQGTASPAGSAQIPEEMRKSVAIYLGSQLLNWIQDDARKVMGDPVTHRYGYDSARNVTSDIYTFRDPTLQTQRIELGFDSKTKRMTNVYMYPLRLTWDDCKRLWGDDVRTVRNTDGTRFHLYKTRRLNVLLDRNNNVINLGLY